MYSTPRFFLCSLLTQRTLRAVPPILLTPTVCTKEGVNGRRCNVLRISYLLTSASEAHCVFFYTTTPFSLTFILRISLACQKISAQKKSFFTHDEELFPGVKRKRKRNREDQLASLLHVIDMFRSKLLEIKCGVATDTGTVMERSTRNQKRFFSISHLPRKKKNLRSYFWTSSSLVLLPYTSPLSLVWFRTD